MATLATCNSPLLLGLGPQDGGVVEAILGDYRQSVAGQEVAQLAEFDRIVADAAQAEGWLFAYASELVGGEHQLRVAEAEARGARPLSSLSTAEKAARVAAGVERGDADLRESLFTPAPDEAPAGNRAGVADISRFTPLPLAEKVERVERGTAAGLTPAEIMRASVSAEE